MAWAEKRKKGHFRGEKFIARSMEVFYMRLLGCVHCCRRPLQVIAPRPYPRPNSVGESPIPPVCWAIPPRVGTMTTMTQQRPGVRSRILRPRGSRSLRSRGTRPLCKPVTLPPCSLPALGVLLAPMTCRWGTTSAAGIKDENVFLTGTSCQDGALGSLGLAGLGIALAVHVPLYLVSTMKECELDPLTDVPLAAGSMVATLRIEALKVASMVSSLPPLLLRAMSPRPAPRPAPARDDGPLPAEHPPRGPAPWAASPPSLRLQLVLHLLAAMSPVLASLLLVFAWSWILYISIVRLPFLGHQHSAFRSASAGVILWMFLAAGIRSAGTDTAAVLPAGAVIVGLAAGGLTWAACKRAIRTVRMFYAIRSELTQSSRRHYKFFDVEEAQVCVKRAVPPPARSDALSLMPPPYFRWPIARNTADHVLGVHLRGDLLSQFPVHENRLPPHSRSSSCVASASRWPRGALTTTWWRASLRVLATRSRSSSRAHP